ncbi:hypothetical protein C7B62_12795 [Pleurocapsa sp. CCALA 161]|nr:hypothetical protein C7B62_12795 [Pleurocapsa sp. CCALA 161]
MLLSLLVNQVTSQVKQTGWVIHRRPKIKYTVIFGQLKIESPYLWNKKNQQGIRPVTEKLGIAHGDYSIGVKRVLTFGAEESFEGAAMRFQEHYGFWVERNAVRREVEAVANLGQQYIEHRLNSLKQQVDDHKNQTLGLPRLVVELDGCQIRTGVYFAAQKAELTPKRQLIPKKRTINWREVRVGFARPVDDQKKGLPIGSGEVESAHRYIPQKRLKIPGATWHPNTINPMLALRVIRANEWWSDFWTHLIEKKLA